MARNFTEEQKALLRAPELDARGLVTFYLDDGTYRFCSDPYDCTDGIDTWIGASALFAATEIRSAATEMAAEPVTITVDGTRVRQMGFSDPAELFRDILSLPLANRRVDVAIGLKYPNQQNIQLVIPQFSGKINAPKLVYPQHRFGEPSRDTSHTDAILQIQLDSLALRYQWSTGRVRSHGDQQEIDSTDMFFSFCGDNVSRESLLYWGKTGPISQLSPKERAQYVVDKFFSAH